MKRIRYRKSKLIDIRKRIRKGIRYRIEYQRKEVKIQGNANIKPEVGFVQMSDLKIDLKLNFVFYNKKKM